MIGIFWKELRENLKWAVVIFGALGLRIIYESRRAGPLFLFDLAEGTLVTMSPMGGLLMGLVQSLFETKPDNWAFVVHRPVSRAGIFAAKCAAGLALLFAALAIPCLLAAAWAAKPGNIPMPFHARMILPLMADVLLSGCYYFAGIVLTLRRARWFGTRLLPIGFALGCSVVTTQMIPEFWQAALLLIVAQGIGALAAWDVFASAGAADGSGAASAGLGITLYAGALLGGFVVSEFPSLFSALTKWQTIQMDREGNVVRVNWSLEPDKSRTSAVTDLAGHSLAQYDGVDLDDPANADRFLRFNSALANDRTITWPLSMFFAKGFRDSNREVIRLRNVARAGVNLRFACLYNRQRQVIELYDPTTHLLEGTVGADGFAPAGKQPGEVFPGGPLNPWELGGTHALAFPSVVYWMELDQRRVRPIYRAAEDDPVFAVVEVAAPTRLKDAGGTAAPGPPEVPTVVIATHKGLHILRPSGEVVTTINMPLELDKYYYQPAILPTNQHLILHVGGVFGGNIYRNEYLEFGSDGLVIRRTEIPPAPEPRRVKVEVTATLGAVFPLWALPIVPLWFPDSVFDVRTQQYSQMFHGFAYGSSICCVLVTLLLGRRYGFSRAKTVAWSIANGLLGPGGLVVMIGLNEMPAREVCPTCSNRRLTGRKECSSCGAGLAPPAFDGREIFEPGEAFQPAM